VKLLNYLLAVGVTLLLQATLARYSRGIAFYVDLTLLPVIWYGIAGTQRSAIGVGCTSGLIHDAWFRLDVFGLSGFKRTLYGWVLGGLGSRFDLNHPPGRFAVGFVVTLADGLLDNVMRRLVDLNQAQDFLALGGRALAMGLLTAMIFGSLDRLRGRRRGMLR
jgi:hypothetical protein